MDTTPNPQVLFEVANGFQRTAAVKAALELDVFTAIGEGADTPAALAVRCQAAARGLRILCDFLVVAGLLAKEGGRYQLTPDTATFFDRRSPVYMGSAVSFFASPTIVEGFNRLTDAVRRGGTAVSQEGTLAPEHPVWVEFARAMASVAGFVAELLAGMLEADAGARWRVLDVAAGHGLFGIALARRNPNAEVVALDWASVLAVAQENAAKAGVADRFRTLPGSAFEVELGGPYDLVLLPNFLHHFDAETCTSFLRKVHAALQPGGRAVIVEFVPNEDRVSPPMAAAFGLVMLAGTPRGDAHTFADYERMLAGAGFTRAELRELVPSPQRVVVGYR